MVTSTYQKCYYPPNISFVIAGSREVDLAFTSILFHWSSCYSR